MAKQPDLPDCGLKPMRADHPAIAATRPSVETAEVWQFLLTETARHPDLKREALLHVLAAALVRRYPGMTVKPQEPTQPR